MMPKNKRATAKTPTLFDFEPESTKQETPAPSSAQDSKQFVDQFMYLLTAPYMFYPPWGDIWTYQDRKNDALMHRLVHGKEIFETQQCTEYEAMIYISTATLSAPPSHGWVNIYMWLSRRWATPEKAAEVGINLPEELDPQEKEDLVGLRRWIYRQQMAHLKAKHKAVEKQEPVPTPEVVEQPKIF